MCDRTCASGALAAGPSGSRVEPRVSRGAAATARAGLGGRARDGGEGERFLPFLYRLRSRAKRPAVVPTGVLARCSHHHTYTRLT